ncbi:uncharacterized protein LOC131062527 isoform X2 [Cryptomeria japonica]|uniref:uncharacterized protein LOC131062527 isoform X2 n=1 Tax=Cryptomeria japonica TaxID=3369 RepID=UPI0027DA956F|nr:uncharacterized protein LOC131062527 isoform X2 [Cryptomeria japonica]
MEAESPQNPAIKEGFGLLGEVHYEDLGNGRLKCLETGHELLLKDADSYGKSKKCRLALIDRALQNKRAPLNSFEQSPLDRCKLICKLTGDTVNKTEEHIWKHISGRKFQNKLAQKESEKKLSKGEKSENGSESKKIRIKVKKKKNVEMDNSDSALNADADSKSDFEEPDFWTPPVGSRWDYDDGRDRWKDSRRSKARLKIGEKTGSKNSIVEEVFYSGGVVAEDITIRTKRMSISVGPSNFASQKKKIKPIDQLVQGTPVEDQVL